LKKLRHEISQIVFLGSFDSLRRFYEYENNEKAKKDEIANKCEANDTNCRVIERTRAKDFASREYRSDLFEKFSESKSFMI